MKSFETILPASTVIFMFSYDFDGFFKDFVSLFQFDNFEVGQEILDTVKENILSDFAELLDSEMSEVKKTRQINLAGQTLDVVRDSLDEEPEDEDPLVWWPSHPEYTALFPVAKMLLQIPASSAENERSFSSASFILDQRRTRLDIDNFRREHRIRRALCVGRTPAEKLEFSNGLIERFAGHVADARDLKAAQEAAQQAARLLNPHR